MRCTPLFVSVGQLFQQSENDKDFKPWNDINELRKPFLANRAFLLDDSDIFQFVGVIGNDFLCQVYVHPGKYLPGLSSYHFAYQKNFPLQEMIDYYLQKIKQGGINSSLFKKYFPLLKQECAKPIKEIELRDTIFMFVVLTSGMMMAMFCYCFEKINWYWF